MQASAILTWMPEVFSLSSRVATRIRGFAAQFCRPNE